MAKFQLMKVSHLQFTFLFLLVLVADCDNALTPENVKRDVLWYNQPASKWIEALPVGNGRIGAMVYGVPNNENIQLNDDSLWPAEMNWSEPDGTPKDLKKIRELLFDGRNAEADALFVEKFSNKGVSRSHQTLGNLMINLEDRDSTDYYRELDLSTGIVTVKYGGQGNETTERVFASSPHRTIVIDYQSEKPMSGSITLSRPLDEGVPTVTISTTEEGTLKMSGIVTQRGGYFRSEPTPILDGVAFESMVKVVNDNGSVMTSDSSLILDSVNRFTLYFVTNTSYYQEDYKAQNTKDLRTILQLDFDEIVSRHVEDHQKYYNRMEFQLESNDLSHLPIDKRIERVKNGADDLGLQELLFQYGRYLLISSSRPGTNPANLQGLWNNHIEAPWNADYHLNINLQMNYWPANVTNLAELNTPLFDYIDRLLVNGQKVAMNNYGCRGSFVPHATDLWAPAWLRAPTAYWGCSIGAGGWLMQHYWQHFKFTADTTFLEHRAMPALRQVAQFYSDWIIEDPRDGSLISAPSTSPENQFIMDNGDTVATCLGSAMDQQIIAEVFDNYLEACDILNVKDELFERISAQRPRLREGFVIDDDGRVLEWDRSYREFEPGHRHMSHLYGFHPGVSVSRKNTPELFDAVAKTLDFRLANGGAGTGWSRACLINFSARLLDGQDSYEHIQLFIQKSTLNNLFCSHPPFQIDGNFGFTAGIAEMLVQSHEGMIRILPALPDKWKTGKVRGLKVRGGHSIDISWKDGVLEEAIIDPQFDEEIEVVYGEVASKLTLKSDILTNFTP